MSALLTAGNIVVNFAGQNITAHCNTADLQATVTELEATDFASTGEESDPGMTGYKINLGGDWSDTIDDILGPEAITPTKKDASLVVGPSGSTVTYAWTAAAFLSSYQFSFSDPKGKATWSAVLNLSGAPSRS